MNSQFTCIFHVSPNAFSLCNRTEHTNVHTENKSIFSLNYLRSQFAVQASSYIKGWNGEQGNGKRYSYLIHVKRILNAICSLFVSCNCQFMTNNKIIIETSNRNDQKRTHSIQLKNWQIERGGCIFSLLFCSKNYWKCIAGYGKRFLIIKVHVTPLNSWFRSYYYCSSKNSMN